MDTASEILVIIVSAVLAIFLIVLIIVGVYAVKVLKQVRRITERAEDVAGSVEAAANTIGRAASPLAVLKLISTVVGHSSKHRKRKD